MDEVLLDVQALSHRFRLTRHVYIQAIDQVSFTIRKGEIFGLVGESGSGKSTVARCVMNIYRPQSGKIFYKGIDVLDRNAFSENKKCSRPADR
jgi:oligopeptide transport system ATP-binding protein